MQGESFKLVLSSKETLIGRIKQRLGSYEGIDVSTALKKTVFADFMQLPDVVVKSNKCIHYLVSREAVFRPDPYPMTVYYKVNGQMVRFGRMEFALVTGLRFGPTNIDPYARHVIPALSVYRRLFGAKSIYPVKLWNWYKDDKNFTDLPYEDCLQISQVLIAALLIFGLDPTSSRIPDFVWILIEKQKDFNKFPWGSLSFQILVKALKNVKHNITSNGYHLIGNTLAFLVCLFQNCKLHSLIEVFLLINCLLILIFRPGFMRSSQ